MKRVAVAWVLCSLAAGAAAQEAQDAPRAAPLSQNADRAQVPEKSPADQQSGQEAKPEKPAEAPKTVASPPTLLVPRDDKVGASEHTPKTEGEKKDWWQSFLSDVKITDVAIAFFTLALVVYTARLNRSTLRLWEAAKEQGADAKQAIAASRDSADAAKQSANIARNALVASNRAWIAGEIIIGDQPLSFSNGGLNFMVGFNLRNIGNAPALNVSFKAWLIGHRINNDPPVVILHERLCAEARVCQPIFEFFLFPDQTFPQSAGFNSMMVQAVLAPEDYEACVFKDQPLGDVLKVFVGGAVNYSFASDPNATHQTSFLYELDRTTAPHMIVVAMGDVPGRELRLGSMPLSDGKRAD